MSLPRLLRQQLESWQAAGLSSLTRVEPLPVSDDPSLLPEGTPRDTATASSFPQTESLPSPMARTASARSTSKKPAESAPVASPAPPESGKPLSRDDRVRQLAVLNEKVRGCTRCGELAETRTQTVFGVGNPLAKILFIGEAPGADEDQQGEPFVGRAGQLLNQIIGACRLKREEIYICNILKCRPPGNRTPAPDECANCREFLDGQLATIDPDYIVCWGTVAAQNLLRSDTTIGKMRGRFYRHGRAKVLCTYHPSYLLRNPAAKKDVWDDMKLLFADMGVDLAAKA